MEKIETTANILKFDSSLGVAFGFAIVCKENGEPYIDTQNDYISEEVMLKAASEFMSSERVGALQHVWDADGKPVKEGQILFAFPLTTEIAKSLNIQTATTGLLIGYKPTDAKMIESFKSGALTGFSIGGSAKKEASE